MKFKSYMKSDIKGNDGQRVGLMKRYSVLKCPPVRKLSDADVTYYVTALRTILVFSYHRF